MKFLVLFVITSIILSCQSIGIPKRDLSNINQKPKHIIITIHGLSGNASTFGYFKEVTEKYLNEANTNYKAEVVNFVYPTGENESQGTYDFALGPKGLDHFINKLYLEKNLTPNDKISFVCHSQGGIIAYMWYFTTLTSDTENSKILYNIENIITLGTPFWGSKIASVLTDDRNPDIIPLMKLFAPEDFQITRREISDLAFGSDIVHNLRSMAIKLDQDPTFKAKLEKMPVRMMNIIGLLPYNKDELYIGKVQGEKATSAAARYVVNIIYHLYKQSYMGYKNKRIENDIAVPVTSSRWNFIYSAPQLIRKNQIIESNSFVDFSQLVNKSKFIFTESSHLPFETEKTLSMAYINQSCIDVNRCDHPTYRYVLEALANCKEFGICKNQNYVDIINKFKYSDYEEYEKFKLIKKNIQSFALQFNLKFKKGTIDSWPVRFFKKKIVYPHGEDINEMWTLKNYGLVPKIIDLGTDEDGLTNSSKNTPYRIYLADPLETKSIDVMSRTSNEKRNYDDIRINLTGRVETISQQKKSHYIVPLKIKIPNGPEVLVKAKVRPGYSTYFELDYTQ